jgi:rod shape-determining protein MreC
MPQFHSQTERYSTSSSYYQSRLFSKRGRSSLSFFLAMAVSLALIIADSHRYLDGVRMGFSLVISPLQYVIDYPVRIVGWVSSLMGTKKALIDENMQLRYQQTMLEAQLQQLRVISKENSQLKALLSATSSRPMKAMAAQILAVDTTHSRQLFVLNKGKRDGVVSGLPVLDAKGVMGQIIDVGWMTSTVLLISDAQSAVPVRNNRTGERAILIGTNSISQLSLINLPRTSSIMKGDLLVTSGLGRRYPEGYPVGRVGDIKNSSGDEFIKVIVSPVALLNRSRLVLVVWPEEGHEALTEQINERFSVMSETA